MDAWNLKILILIMIIFKDQKKKDINQL